MHTQVPPLPGGTATAPLLLQPVSNRQGYFFSVKMNKPDVMARNRPDHTCRPLYIAAMRLIH